MQSAFGIFMQCSICKSPYDDPRTLPCGHTFCAACIEQQIGVSAVCSICQTAWTLPNDGVRSLHQNDSIAKLCSPVSVDVAICSNVSSSDANEIRHGAAQYFCLNCWKGLCAKCYSVHIAEVTERHRVKLVASITEADLNDRRLQLLSFCSTHENQKLGIFCRHCLETICLMCVATTHANHKHQCVKLDTISDMITVELQKVQEGSLQRSTEASEQIDLIDNVIIAVDVDKTEKLLEVREHSARLRSKTDEMYMKIINKINDAEEEAKKSILEQVATKHNHLQAAKNGCIEKMNKLQQIVEALEMILNSSTSVVEKCVFSKLFLESEILQSVGSEEPDALQLNMQREPINLVCVSEAVNFGENFSNELRVEATLKVLQSPQRSLHKIERQTSQSHRSEHRAPRVEHNGSSSCLPQRDSGDRRQEVGAAARSRSQTNSESEGDGHLLLAVDAEPRTVIRCTYAEGQWSPWNPNGRKRYDVEFLLQFEEACRYLPVQVDYFPGCTAPPEDAPIYKTMMCRYIPVPGCVKGKNCLFAHTPEELRPKPKWLMCRTVEERGYCMYGDGCVFAHTEEERREAEEARLLAMENGNTAQGTTSQQTTARSASQNDEETEEREMERTRHRSSDNSNQASRSQPRSGRGAHRRNR